MRLKNIKKSFGRVEVLKGIDFSLDKARVCRRKSGFGLGENRKPVEVVARKFFPQKGGGRGAHLPCRVVFVRVYRAVVRTA